MEDEEDELNLEFWRRKCEFVLDQFLFINSYFTDMRLAQCKLNPSGAICCENLRTLSLYWVNVDEELLVNIISGSPLLETLVLVDKWPNIPSESEFDMTEISAPTSLSLTHCPQLKHLKKFQLFIFYVEFHPQISNLISYAIRCNVKEINMEFWDVGCGYEFMIDEILFTLSCFTKLRLRGCKLNSVGAIGWESLRFLCLSGYESLDEDLIEKILSGSPVLETLELSCCGYRRLDITSKSVKNLVLYGYKVPYGGSEDDVIEFNAPNILSLTIQSIDFLGNPLLLNVSSLVKALLNYTCREVEHRNETPTKREQKILKRFIMKLRHVKELELGSLCVKVLSCLEAKGFVSPSNVKLSGIM